MGEPLPHQDDPTAGATATIKTLVVTDLVDSTRLFATLGDHRAAALSARHERLARDLLVHNGGREIDKTDGFLLLFDRTLDAVRFALAYHRTLADLSDDEEGVALEARVGIHLGEVILRPNPSEDVARGAKPVELEGYAKPVAARVMSLAKGRQTLLTRGAFDLARQAAGREPLAEGGLRWLAHGPYVLKGVAEPVEIFEVGEQGFAPLRVPRSTAKARRAVSAAEELTLGWRPAPGLEVPRRPKWRLAEKLGAGGFGEVWRAAHRKTGENRVFKFCYEAERLRSLQREVTLFRLLKESLGAREDIARILDWNFDEAPYFLECEYTEGGDLLEWVADQGGAEEVPLATRLELVAQVAEALAAAHSVGVLHKDVKPSNVLITTGKDGSPKVRLTDFGIGLVTDREVLARQGITVYDLTEMVAENPRSTGGTHLYMAPELVEGRTPTVQADVYALGVLLFQFVTGDFSRALAHGWRRDVPDEILQEDLEAMVDGHPERRLRDAQEVAHRLRSLEERRARREAERREQAEREAERRALERAQRRRRAALAIAAISVAVLVVVAALALQAVDARREAERRRGQAEKLIGFMVGDLREKLEPIGRLDVLDEVGSEALAYFEGVPKEDLTREERFQRSQTLYQIGDVRAASGELEEAELAFRQSLDLARMVSGEVPDNLRFRKGLATSHFGVGFALWRQARLDAALEHFRAYLAIAEELVRAEPDNPEWTLELAYAESNIASVHEARRDLESAASALERSLALRSELVASDPSNEVWRRGLAVAHNKLGSVLESQGRPLEALEHFRADLRMTEELVNLAPEDTQRRHRLAVATSFVGHALCLTGSSRECLENYARASALFEELHAADPGNLVWARDLAVHRRHHGAALGRTGELGRAVSMLRGSVSILESLVEKNPADVGWRKGLVLSRLRLAEHLLERGDRPASEAVLDSSFPLLDGAGDLSFDPEVSAVLRSRAHILRGDLASDREAAVAEWTTASRRLEPYVEGNLNRRVLRARARVALRLGDVGAAREAVGRLVELGYRDPEIDSLARRTGLNPPEAPPAPASTYHPEKETP